MVISMHNVPWIDPDGMDALESMVTMPGVHGARVVLASPRPKVAQALAQEAGRLGKMAKARQESTLGGRIISGLFNTVTNKKFAVLGFA